MGISFEREMLDVTRAIGSIINSFCVEPEYFCDSAHSLSFPLGKHLVVHA